MNLSKISFLVLLSILFSSCFSDLDFKQSKDIAISPVMKMDLVYFKIFKPTFIAPANVVSFPSDSTNIKVFNSDLFSGNVNRAVLKFEVENSFDKKFIIDFVLLDDANNIMQSIPLAIDAHSLLKKNITYDIGSPEYDNLIRTKEIKVLIKKNPPLADFSTSDDSMFLHFKSAIDLFLIIDDF